jgi:pyridoxine 4-dehydrogenase
VTTVQNRYSLADRRHEETLELVRAAGHRLPALVPDGRQAAQAGQSLARRRWPDRRPPLGHGWQLSLAWLLQRSPVMLPIPGTSKVAHLEENVAAAGSEAEIEQFTRGVEVLVWIEAPQVRIGGEFCHVSPLEA